MLNNYENRHNIYNIYDKNIKKLNYRYEHQNYFLINKANNIKSFINNILNEKNYAKNEEIYSCNCSKLFEKNRIYLNNKRNNISVLPKHMNFSLDTNSNIEKLNNKRNNISVSPKHMNFSLDTNSMK